MEYGVRNFELIAGLGMLYMIIWLITMNYIKSNGHNISIFSSRIKDLNLIFEVSKRYNHRFIRILHFFHYLFILTFPIFLGILFFSSAPSSNFARCEIVEHFKNQEYRGVMIDKYIDNEQHATETVVLQGIENKINVYDFSYLNESNFEYVQIGDSVIKNKGQLYILVIRDTIQKQFYLSIDCDIDKYQKELKNINNE